ncbi:unnamed protein product [Alopecurus aequalis]
MVQTKQKVSPPCTVSAFLKKGVLSPDEFVLAGDKLVSCTGFEWEARYPELRKPFFPVDKQYLVITNVACCRRVVSGKEDRDAEIVLDDDEAIRTYDMIFTSRTVRVPFLAQNQIWRHCCSLGVPCPSRWGLEPVTLDDGYDGHYQTPRVWLSAFDLSGTPLTPELMFEDISQDNSHISMTFEAHPHQPTMHQDMSYATVHPCINAAVMKKIIADLTSQGVEPEIDKYLLIFLKFMASVIPYIEYAEMDDLDREIKKRC